MPLPRRALSRTTVVAAALVAFLAAGVGIASAHVTVRSPNASSGGFGVVVFTVPNESDSASTTRVRIQIPESTPLASVSVEQVPGWTVTTTQTTLKKPLTTDDGVTVTTATSVIDFEAAKGGIPPGQFQEFRLSGGPFPNGATMTFNVIQTYSDGTEAAWIEPTIEGQPEPQHPAPVLTLTSAASSDTGSAPAATTTSSSSSSSGTSWPAWLALGIAVLALLVALAGVLTGRRRTVGS